MRERTVILLATLVLVAACGDGQESDAVTPGGASPNFLIIFADDMGFTDLGAFGGVDIDTPNLDQLALGGIRFNNFHGHVSCAPSRAMLLSGTGNHEAGLGTQVDIESFRGEVNYERYLVDRVAILPEILQAGGYRTYLAGKWGLSGPGDLDPTQRGFDKSFALIPSGGGHYEAIMHDARYSHNGQPVPEKLEPVFSTTLYTDALISFLREDNGSDAPFFAMFTPTAPHWPLQFPPGMKSRFAGKYDDGYEHLKERRIAGASRAGVLPAGVETDGYVSEAKPWQSLSDDEKRLQTRLMEIYAAMVTHLDMEVGRLLETLRDTGELENTLILFINDNGAQGGPVVGGPRSYRLNREFDNSFDNVGNGNSWVNLGQGWAEAITAPFRDNKGSVYEGGLRVAAFANWNELSDGGVVNSQYLTNMDVMPTLLEVAGITHPAPQFAGREVLSMRGKSFAGLLQGENEQVHSQRETIVLSSAGRHFAQRGQWKILKELNATWELYDLATDPYERRNLAEQHPEILRELQGKFEAQAVESNILDR